MGVRGHVGEGAVSVQPYKTLQQSLGHTSSQLTPPLTMSLYNATALPTSHFCLPSHLNQKAPPTPHICHSRLPPTCPVYGVWLGLLFRRMSLVCSIENWCIGVYVGKEVVIRRVYQNCIPHEFCTWIQTPFPANKWKINSLQIKRTIYHLECKNDHRPVSWK